jgi:hypothetical protein
MIDQSDSVNKKSAVLRPRFFLTSLNLRKLLKADIFAIQPHLHGTSLALDPVLARVPIPARVRAPDAAIVN